MRIGKRHSLSRRTDLHFRRAFAARRWMREPKRHNKGMFRENAMADLAQAPRAFAVDDRRHLQTRETGVVEIRAKFFFGV